jgi:DNA repair exonuclease SbcCD ATPase subunit
MLSTLNTWVAPVPDNPLEGRVQELEKRCSEYASLFRALGKFSEKERDILLKAIAEEERLRVAVESLKGLEVRVAKLEKVMNRLPTPKVNRDILDKMESLSKRLRAFETQLAVVSGGTNIAEKLEDIHASLDKKVDSRVLDLAARVTAIENAVAADRGSTALEDRLAKLETLVDTLVDIVNARGAPAARSAEVRPAAAGGEPEDWKDSLLSAHNQLALALKSIKGE